MIKRNLLLGGATLLAGALIMPHVLAQNSASKTPAVYWMTAETSAGMMVSAANAANAAKPSARSIGGAALGGMLGGLLGRGGGRNAAAEAPAPAPTYTHALRLQLASGQKAPAVPTAEHVPPQGLQTGTLPLVSPQQPREPERKDPVEQAREMGKPKGRMLIYWGCGERAGPGQPVVIDFANLAAGKIPQGLMMTGVPSMVGLVHSSYAGYGEWPNPRSTVAVPANGKLAGAHVIRGNYSPEIKFTVAPDQDFLDPVTLTAQQPGASGAVPLAWQAIPGAKAWLATTIGASGKGDVVIWSSSSTQIMAMGLDFVEQSAIPGLVQKGTLLPGNATRCTVPAEVAKASEGSMLNIVALGGEANFSHPIRPKNAPAGWQPDWTAKLRVKSTYAGMLGMDLAAMAGN